LRRFGATIHPTARIRPSVEIEIPWHLTIGANSSVGDYAVLYCLAPVILGDRVTVSQYAHLCAGTHDHTRRSMPLVPRPIALEDDVWIATDVFVGPGVRVGAGTVVGARSSVFGNLPPWKVCVGTPARPVRDRVLTDG
jgi:putative colanic acid biosynthesis acetyltransferase WcaF